MGSGGVPDFDALHSRVNDRNAVALAFDLLALDGDDFRKKPFSERKAALRKVLWRTRRLIQYIEHSEGRRRRNVQSHLQARLRGLSSQRSSTLPISRGHRSRGSK